MNKAVSLRLFNIIDDNYNVFCNYGYKTLNAFFSHKTIIRNYEKKIKKNKKRQKLKEKNLSFNFFIKKQF